MTTEPATEPTAATRSPSAEERLAHWHVAGYDRAVALTERFASMVRGLDAAQLEAPVPDLDWTARDVVAHVASVYRRYTLDHRRAPTPREVDTANAADIEALAADLGDDVGAMLDDMAAQLAFLGTVLDSIPPDQPFPFHGGREITMAGGWGNMVGELLAHGDDVARAAGVTWTVDAADLEPTWCYASPVLGGWLTDAGRAATDRWRLDLGLPGGPIEMRFTGGDLVVGDPGVAPPDHVVVGDGAEVMLAVPYGRRRITDPALAELATRFVPL